MQRGGAAILGNILVFRHRHESVTRTTRNQLEGNASGLAR